MSRVGAKGGALPGGPAGAFAVAFGAVGAVYLLMKYVRSKQRQTPRTLATNGDPNLTVSLPLIKITKISHDTKIFRFGLPEGHRLGLPVGQHVNVKARIKDKLVIRAYTPISSDDDLGYVDMLIKVYYPIERFPEGGKMTQHIDNMEIGDKLDFVGPKGHIIYKRNGQFLLRGKKKSDPTTTVFGIKNIGMIAGGSGITPMLQVVRDVFKNESEETKIHLLFANQTEKDILLREEIEEIKEKYPSRFSFMYTIDRPEEGWSYQKGFINQEMIEQYLPLPGEDSMILICGPPPMVEYACLPNLAKAGHKTERILVY